MQRERFEQLVAEAIESLPDEFKEKLENVAVMIQDWPTRAQLTSVGLRYRDELLGLYEGIPLTTSGKNYATVLPDKVTIFRKPIELTYRSDERIVRGIAETVRHEIAHHFGISDARLTEMKRQRYRVKRGRQK
jgi:predicted Zn-dependent protease with MMP-like domain